MTATKTTIDDFCFSIRHRFEEWRIEAWAHAKVAQQNPTDQGKLRAIEHLLSQAVTVAGNLSTVIAAQTDQDTLDWLCWAESFASRDLAEMRRAYRVAQFHCDPTEQTMAAAMGWYSTNKIAEARARLTA